MGKIVAIGGGSVARSETEKIINHICSLSNKKTNKVLFLPTAAFDSDDDFEILCDKFGKYGYTVSQLLLTDDSLSDDEIRDAILGCDIIYAGGGNLKFLMDTWIRRGADKYLKLAYERGTVLSGSSSGSMCWFERGYDDCGEDHAYIFVDCLGLLPYCNCPHFENKNWRKFRFAAPKAGVPSVAVENRCAFSYVDGKISVIKSQWNRKAYYLCKERGYKLCNISRKKIQNMLEK